MGVSSECYAIINHTSKLMLVTALCASVGSAVKWPVVYGFYERS